MSSPPKNIKCSLAYCGTRYFGWQKTKMGPSIEQAVENCLAQILQHPIQLQAASRTDRGVHAKGQKINFFTEKDLPLEKLEKSMQSLLPSDISLLKIELVHDSFHPTLDAVAKEYHYTICNGPVQLPFNREFSWHVYYPLDRKKMELAAAYLEGTHDFSAFSIKREDKGFRHIHHIRISPSEQGLILKIKGDNFLYKMARNLVGTLVYVGYGKIPLKKIPEIVEGKDRTQAGVTAPAHGLALQEVFY